MTCSKVGTTKRDEEFFIFSLHSFHFLLSHNFWLSCVEFEFFAFAGHYLSAFVDCLRSRCPIATTTRHHSSFAQAAAHCHSDLVSLATSFHCHLVRVDALYYSCAHHSRRLPSVRQSKSDSKMG